MTKYLLEGACATANLAAKIAPHLVVGDLVGLSGGLGAGKSHFARALISQRLAETEFSGHIPSPTYTLVQVYDTGSCEIWHSDLYRLGDPEEITELGLEDAFQSGICIVEWAERLGQALPPRRLMLNFGFSDENDDARTLEVETFGTGWGWLQGVITSCRLELQ